jgi:hypothetical protein
LAGTRAQSGDWYGSGTLHSGQVLRGSLPLLSPGRIMSMKNSDDTIGNRYRDLPVCSAVPQPLRHRVPPHLVGSTIPIYCITMHGQQNINLSKDVSFMCLSTMARCSSFRQCIGMQQFRERCGVVCVRYILVTTKDEPISVILSYSIPSSRDFR